MRNASQNAAQGLLEANGEKEEPDAIILFHAIWGYLITNYRHRNMYHYF